MRLAVIPARGGSKRIPRKNVRDFMGKPMIAHSIAAAQRAQCFDRIIVSTDDAEIAEIATHWGAEVPFMRPAHLADDFAITADVIAHAIASLRNQGVAMDYVCCIYATAPLLTPSSLKAGWQLIQGAPLDFVFSSCAFDFPIQRALLKLPNGRVSMVQPEHRLTRSQDLPTTYHDAGQFYWGTPEAWLEKRPIFSEQSAMVVLPKEQAQDIDTEADWRQAEFLWQFLQSQAGR